MAREVELKLLGVDEGNLSDRLLAIGAKARGVELQRIFTYDFPPYWSFVPGLTEVILRGSNEPPATRKPALKRMASLLVDLDDLLDGGSKKRIAGEAQSLTVAWEGSVAEGRENEFMSRLVEVTRHLGVNPNKWIRLRCGKEGATLAVKQIFGRRVLPTHREHEVTSVEEIEVGVAEFEGGKALLEALGFFPKSYQEKRRTRFIYGQRVHIDLDQWPLIPAYAEVEAPTVEEIFEVGRLIGAKPEDFCSMNADDVFSHYGLNMYDYQELKF